MTKTQTVTETLEIPELVGPAQVYQEWEATGFENSIYNDHPMQDVVVFVFDRRDVKITVSEHYKRTVRLRPGCHPLAMSTSKGADDRDIQYSLPYREFPMKMRAKALVYFRFLVGEFGVSWFAELWARTIPWCWQHWKPKKSADDERS